MDGQQWTLIPELGLAPSDSTPSAQVAELGDIGQQRLLEAASIMPSLLAGPTAAVPSTTMSQPLRKSCDFCRSRKKKCDGPMASDGAGRCRFCASKGLEECVYSERRSSAPKTRSRSSNRPQEGDIKGADRGEEKGTPPWFRPASFSVEAFEGVPVKRCRLSASPATGLVGMQENVFLSDYFECMALLPLTDESEIRSAMVVMMRSVLPPNQQGLHSSVQPRSSRIGLLPGGGPSNNGSQSGLPPAASAVAAPAGAAAAAAARAARLRSDAGASTCALWCAVAMGALVHGWPTSSVSGYVELAREALKECFDVASVAAMRAFTIMAFLSNFIGEPDKFQKYLMFAHGMHRSLPPRDVPKAAVDMLLTADSAVLYSGMPLTVNDMEHFCRIDESTSKPAESMAHKSDRCRLLISVHHRLEQAFFKDMTEQGILSRPFPANPSEGSDESGREDDRQAPAEKRDDSLTEFGGVLNGAEDAQGVDRRRGASERTPLLTLTVVEGKDPEPPPIGEITQRRVLDEVPELERLAADISWPEIKTGVGGIIFNIRMCLLHYLRNDYDRAKGSAKLVADILLRWPGLCRFSPWLHTMHLALGSLAREDSAAEYEQLREAYNPVRPVGEPEAPPLEDWKDMGCICQHVFCRSLFSKRWKKDLSYRRDMLETTLLETTPSIDVLDSSDQSEALWKDGLIDEGLLSLLEGDDGEGEGAEIGLGVGHTVDVI